MGLLAADVQYILNTIPIAGYFKSLNLDTTFIDVLGGFKVGRGRIQTKHHYAANAQVGSFGEGDDLSTTGKQSRRTLNHVYKRAYGSFGVDGLQEAIAAAGGIQEINDLILEEANSCIADILKSINTQLLGDGTGNSAKDIDGVLYHIDDDNTWGALSRGSYAWIQSYCNDNSGTPRDLSIALLRDIRNTMVNTRAVRPNVIWANPEVADAYEDLLEDKKRFVNVQIADLRMDAMLYDKMPVIPVPGYASNRLDMVRSTDFEIHYLPQTVQDQLGRTNTGIFKVEPIAKTSDEGAFRIIAYLNLVCKHPWAQGSLQDVQ